MPRSVVSAEDMDDETFIKHFNKRHADQLPGLVAILPSIDQETLLCYRLFHEHLHNWLRMEMPHEHSNPSSAQPQARAIGR